MMGSTFGLKYGWMKVCMLFGLLGVSAVICAGVVSVVVSDRAKAVQTIPYKINFQGRLTDSSGNTKPNGLYNMKIRLYGVASGGSALGEEVRDGGYRVQVTNGLFSIQIGDNSILSPAAFTTYPLYIEIELPTPATATCAAVGCGTWTEGPMSPRSGLGSTATAFNADTIDGIDGASMARKDASNTFSVNNTFNGKTQINDTLSVVTFASIGFNSDMLMLQNAGTGGYITNDYRGLSVSAMPNDIAGSAAYNASTLRFVANNNIIQATVNAGATQGDNLLSNPGFEFGQAGWRYTNGTVAGAADSRNGAGSLRVQQPAATALLDSASNLIAVTPGDVLTYGGYVKVNNTAAGSGGYLLVYYNAQGTVVNYSTADGYSGGLPDTSYNLKAGIHTVPAGAVYVELFATVRGDGSVAGTWHFDDAFVRKSSQSTPTFFRNAIDSASAFAIQNAGGGSLLVADTSTNTLRVGGGHVGADPWPALFYVDNKSTSGDPAGRDGAMYYNVATKKFRCYEDGGWKDCIPSTASIRDSYAYRQEFEGALNTGANSSAVIDNTLSAFANGTISNVSKQPNEVNRPGIYRLSNGTSASGNAFITTRLLASSVQYMPYKFGNGAIEMSAGVRIATLGISTQNYVSAFGYVNNLVSNTSGCFMRYAFSAGSTWQGVCATSGTPTVCDTGVTVSVDTWYDLKVAINSDGTAATFVVDGNASCSVASTIPSASTDLSLQLAIARTAGSTVRTIDVDYLTLTYAITGR